MPIHPSCPHFAWEEVADPSQPLVNSLLHLCLEASDRFWRHMEKLEKLRAEYALGLRVTSGYRSPVHNRDVGGASQSQHMVFATDIVPVNLVGPLLLSWWKQAASDIGFTGIGLYPDHLHLDIRPGQLVVWEES